MSGIARIFKVVRINCRESKEIQKVELHGLSFKGSFECNPEYLPSLTIFVYLEAYLCFLLTLIITKI